LESNFELARRKIEEMELLMLLDELHNVDQHDGITLENLHILMPQMYSSSTYNNILLIYFMHHHKYLFFNYADMIYYQICKFLFAFISFYRLFSDNLENYLYS
jgi:hypothetical protein